MDPRIKILIAAVRRNHVPLFTKPTYNQVKTESYCWGCKGLVYDCPVIKAALELEKEDAEEKSITAYKTSS